MKQISLISIMLIFLASSAFAVLQDNSDGTVTQIRDDGSVLMWLQDANYALTSGYNDGWMTWDEAFIWIETLNNSKYLGYNDWRLPTTLPGTDMTFSFDGSTDHGYNNTVTEMGYLFYSELGNLGRYDITGNEYSENWFTNSGLFINIQANAQNQDSYWSTTEYTPLTRVWYFRYTPRGRPPWPFV